MADIEKLLSVSGNVFPIDLTNEVHPAYETAALARARALLECLCVLEKAGLTETHGARVRGLQCSEQRQLVRSFLYAPRCG